MIDVISVSEAGVTVSEVKHSKQMICQTELGPIMSTVASQVKGRVSLSSCTGK